MVKLNSLLLTATCLGLLAESRSFGSKKSTRAMDPMIQSRQYKMSKRNTGRINGIAQSIEASAQKRTFGESRWMNKRTRPSSYAYTSVVSVFVAANPQEEYWLGDLYADAALNYYTVDSTVADAETVTYYSTTDTPQELWVSETYPVMGCLKGGAVTDNGDLQSGSHDHCFLTWMDETQDGSYDANIQSAAGGDAYPAQSYVWSLDKSTGQLLPVFMNSDGSDAEDTLWCYSGSNGAIFMTSDLATFNSVDGVNCNEVFLYVGYNYS